MDRPWQLLQPARSDTRHDARDGRGLRAHRVALAERQRELAICIAVRDVRYAWTHHALLARRAGVTEAELAAIQVGQVPEGLSAADGALCRLAFAVAGRDGTPEAVWQVVRPHFTPRQATDIAVLVAYYIATGVLIAGLGVQLESDDPQEIERVWQGHGRPAASPGDQGA